MLANKARTGRLGEDLACRYLRSNGYKIIDRNYRKAWGELDIIAISPSKILVFVEVKTINGPGNIISPEEQVTGEKKKKLNKIAQYYANRVRDRDISKNGWRIDLIAITIEAGSATIKHYKNI